MFCGIREKRNLTNHGVALVYLSNLVLDVGVETV